MDKFQILEVGKEDACFSDKKHAHDNYSKKNNLIGKIGFGNLVERSDKPGFFSGGLNLSFMRSVAVYQSYYERKKGVVAYVTRKLSTEYVYFTSVRVLKVGA